MNLFDVAVIGLLLVATWGGYRAGLVGPAFGLAGALVGIVIVIAVAPLVEPALAEYDQPLRAILAVGGALAVVVAGDAIGSAIGGTFHRRVQGHPLGVLDRVGGVAFGALQALLAVWLVGGLLATSSFEGLAGQAQRSTAMRVLLDELPPPDAVIANLGGLLDEAGLPQVFIGLEPLPASPAPAPGQAVAEALASTARASAVRVEGVACGQVLIGTGFSVKAGYFVTNAHVVAGATNITVSPDAKGGRYAATAVLFDPQLDVAVLRVTRLSLPALHFAAQAPGRGTPAVALGHPEGAALTAVPAAVNQELSARGRDIYGKNIVLRDVLELHAAVRPGDSGGPLIVAGGTVGGLVFAESRSDPEVGYALDPSDVAREVLPALTRTTAVGVGACTP
ncbi:MAG: MarP family serine protease [Candidatus Limnocylindrales bacterium]